MSESKLKSTALDKVQQDGQLPSEVAKELGISSRLLYRWLREPKSTKSQSRQCIEDEIEKLTRKLHQLRQQMRQLEQH